MFICILGVIRGVAISIPNLNKQRLLEASKRVLVVFVTRGRRELQTKYVKLLWPFGWAAHVL